MSASDSRVSTPDNDTQGRSKIFQRKVQLRRYHHSAFDRSPHPACTDYK